MQKIRLTHSAWTFEESKPLGKEGGFGAVFEGTGEDGDAVAVKRLKLDVGELAHRELKIAQHLIDGNHEYIMPILDYGQDSESDRYFIVMPQASQSLQDLLDSEISLDEDATISILLSIAKGLVEADEFVHRDLKPGNVLLHGESWKLADFGIARFVEVSTSLNTLKDCLSPMYAAPEQWRLERVTHATDIYALGCIAFACLTGSPPFVDDDLRDCHLNREAPSLTIGDPKLRTLVSMALRKTPTARPSISRIIGILEAIQNESESTPESSALHVLQVAGAEIAERDAMRDAEKEKAKSENQVRQMLFTEASKLLFDLVDGLTSMIAESTPSAVKHNALSVQLGGATLRVQMIAKKDYPIDSDAFPLIEWDVIAGATIEVRQTTPEYAWSASLWYAKHHRAGDYRWREASYFSTPFQTQRPVMEPYALSNAKRADEAMSSKIMGIDQVAWGPKTIDDEDSTAFINRWVNIFAKAARGNLQHPTHLPLPQ